MSQRLGDATKWFCILVIYASPTWTPVQCVTVNSPPKTPSTIEAQAKFFQYRHLPTDEDYEQGHRLGSEKHFTERHERSKPSEGLFSAKVRWGDKKGGYGEHYWDLNHGGHTGDHDSGYDGNSDDGSYREEHNNDVYEEPSEYSPKYDDGYDPEKVSKFDINRAKRAHPRTRHEKKTYNVYEKEDENDRTIPRKRQRVESNRPDKPNDQNSYRKTVTAKHQNNYDSNEEDDDDSEDYEPETEDDEKERKQVVLVLSQKEKGDFKNTPIQHDKPTGHFAPQNTQQFVPQKTQLQSSQPQQFQSFESSPHDSQQFSPVVPQQFAPQSQPSYVPYEGGAGLRQHQQPETSASAAVPRLFLEPSTGHIIDRTTGRAYVLQPLSAT